MIEVALSILAVCAALNVFANFRRNKILKGIMATQQEAAVALQAVKDQIVKIGAETSSLLTKVTDLLAIIAAGGEVSTELQNAIDAVKAQAQIVDDLVPDQPPTPGPGETSGQ